MHRTEDMEPSVHAATTSGSGRSANQEVEGSASTPASNTMDETMPDPPCFDRLLVARMIRGEEESFTAFFDAHFPPLYRFALRRLGGCADLAEEIVQKTMCAAIDRIASWRGEAQLSTWLCAICRNEIAAHFRRQPNRLVSVELEEDVPEIRAALESMRGEVDGPEHVAMRREIADLVHAALDELPQRYALALEWMYLDGASMKEIAARLGATPKAVESLLTRARGALREALASLLGGTPLTERGSHG